MSKIKDDLTLKAVLGTEVYESVKKYIPAWRDEYDNRMRDIESETVSFDDKSVSISTRVPMEEREAGVIKSVWVPWLTFLEQKIKEHQNMKEWSIYSESGHRVGTVKATSETEAVKKYEETACTGEHGEKLIGTFTAKPVFRDTMEVKNDRNAKD